MRQFAIEMIISRRFLTPTCSNKQQLTGDAAEKDNKIDRAAPCRRVETMGKLISAFRRRSLSVSLTYNVARGHHDDKADRFFFI